MNRPKSRENRDLPPRMLRRVRRMKSGEVWVGYYYAGRAEDGRRVEIPLGTDKDTALRKWAECEGKPQVAKAITMGQVLDRYKREIVPTKAPRTQRGNLAEIEMLRRVFQAAPLDEITPQHIAQYRDARRGPDGKPAPVRANRELALLSHAFNLAREWGYTARENPCRGVRKHREKPRDFYADNEVWRALYEHAAPELQDAMDLAYLTGQRPGDVRRMRQADVSDGALVVTQSKTGKKLRILLNNESGQRTELGRVIDRIRSRQVQGAFLVATPQGRPLREWTLRDRWDAARQSAIAAQPDTDEGRSLAQRIASFQFRDIRPKAASEMDLATASKLLGHTEQAITQTVYRRAGETVKPTR